MFDELDSPGDLTVRERLLHLGRPGLRRPLIEVDGDRIRILEHGRRVLAYERRADVSVIFDHIGGVPLDLRSARAWYGLLDVTAGQ